MKNWEAMQEILSDMGIDNLTEEQIIELTENIRKEQL